MNKHEIIGSLYIRKMELRDIIDRAIIQLTDGLHAGNPIEKTLRILEELDNE